MAVKLKTSDPIWWALFSGGGTVAAFLIPAHVLITGLGIAFGWVSPETLQYQRIQPWLSHPIIKVYLFVLITLPLFHWAHRFRYVLIDIGLRKLKGPVAFICYGGAIGGSILVTLLLLFGL